MTPLAALYGLLYAASLVLINPWGGGPSYIWTQPRVVVITLIAALNLWTILQSSRQEPIVLSKPWKQALWLWLLFLAIGCISSLLSHSPLSSLLGWSHIGINLIYWWVLAVFVLSNALVLRLRPSLFYAQLSGLLAGGVLLALSIFPQVLNPHLDYTATLGQLSSGRSGMLASGIYVGEMPVGFYSHRGHAAFPLAAIGTLILVGVSRGWMRPVVAGIVYVLVCTALFYTQTRSGVLALLAGIVYLFWQSRSSPKKLRTLLIYGVGLLVVSYFFFQVSTLLMSTGTQKLALENASKLAYEPVRFHLWKLSIKGIMSRPLWGWGFGGFGSAFPYVAEWAGNDQRYLFEKVPVSEVVKIHQFIFEYIGTDGNLHVGFIRNIKAHNFFLDTILTVGIIGLLAYMALLGFFIWRTIKSPVQGIEAIAITYLVYTLLWFESAQFSHLAWWALSTGFIGLGHSIPQLQPIKKRL